MNQRNVPELLLLASFFLPVLQVPKESWEAPSRAERSAQSWSPRARSPWRGGPRRWVPSTRWAPESVCLAGGLRSQTCRRRAKGELRALAKDAAFGTHGFCWTPLRLSPGVPIPERSSGKWGFERWGRREAGAVPGVRHPEGTRGAQWVGASLTAPGLGGCRTRCLRRHCGDQDVPRPRRGAGRGVEGREAVLLALFSLNNSNSQNSQGNPLHSEPCKLRLTHTLKLYV